MSVEVPCFVFELSRTPNQAISGTKPGTKFFSVLSLVSNEKISRAQAFAHRLRAPQDVAADAKGLVVHLLVPKGNFTRLDVT